MTYGQSLEYITDVLPNFQQVGSSAFHPGLEGIQTLCKELGTPQDQYPTVHIAGTNGKGSTASMLTSVLMEAGYTVGLFTSPHMRDPRERIRTNGKLIPKEAFASFIFTHQSRIEQLGLSFFEVSVAMAYDWFARSGVEIAIIEAGMGGEMDATNVIQPVLAVLTNVSNDHIEWLGPTLKDIARNKAGIIKPKSRVVLAPLTPDLQSVIQNQVTATGAELVPSPSWKLELFSENPFGQHFRVSEGEKVRFENLNLDLTGKFQRDNLRLALTALKALKPQFEIPHSAMLRGFANVKANTSLTGRMTFFPLSPAILLDVGHNEAAIRETFDKLSSSFPHDRLFVVWGMVSGKDHSAVLNLLPKDATYLFVQPDLPRALDANELMKTAQVLGLQGTAYESVEKGLEAALEAAAPHDLIFVGGSHFVVAEALPYVRTLDTLAAE